MRGVKKATTDIRLLCVFVSLVLNALPFKTRVMYDIVRYTIGSKDWHGALGQFNPLIQKFRTTLVVQRIFRVKPIRSLPRTGVSCVVVNRQPDNCYVVTGLWVLRVVLIQVEQAH